MWDVVFGRCDEALRETLIEPEDDDQFDAIVGYVLGAQWVRGDDNVVLLGDRVNGAMLLPRGRPVSAMPGRSFQSTGGA